ncbi:MAG: TIGR01841 family phasin [Pseudomonadota bacterium]
MSDKNPMNAFMDMFKDFGSNMNVPTPQIEDVLDYHRKNLQALQDAAQASSAGGQAMIAKQREALEGALADISDMVQGASEGAKDPSKMMGGGADLATKSFEMTVKHASEMSEIARESGTETFNILKNRVEESLSELTGGMMGSKK